MACKWRALRVLNLQRFQCDESQAVPDLSIYLPLRFRIWIPGTLQGSLVEDDQLFFQLAAVHYTHTGLDQLQLSSHYFVDHHFLLTLETATDKLVHSLLLFLVINSYKFYSINILFVIQSILSIQSR